MRVLRFLRPVRSSASAVPPNASGEALGLDAFATEAARPARLTAAADNAARSSVVMIALGVLVVLEAVPTVLWFQSWLVPAAPVAMVAAAAAAPAPMPGSAASDTPPCAPPAAQPGIAAGMAATRPEENAKIPLQRVAAPGLVAGLVSITAPVPMHVYAEGRLVGTTEAETILLPVGEHDLELVNEAVGLRTRRTVTVQAGRTTALQIEPPRVSVHVNAVPWAEVWIDNQRVGETPIGNLQQTIGSHEVVFRHPELGERRMIVMITMKEPARISMDLRKR
jgi:hypothetical protein